MASNKHRSTSLSFEETDLLRQPSNNRTGFIGGEPSNPPFSLCDTGEEERVDDEEYESEIMRLKEKQKKI